MNIFDATIGQRVRMFFKSDFLNDEGQIRSFEFTFLGVHVPEVWLSESDKKANVSPIIAIDTKEMGRLYAQPQDRFEILPMAA